MIDTPSCNVPAFGSSSLLLPMRAMFHWTGILTRMFEKKRNDPPGQSLVPIQLETPIETLAAAEERYDSKGGIE